MPKKTAPPPDPSWQVILEDIQSQNRATLEAVETFRAEAKRELHDFREETRGNFATVFAVLRDHTKDIGELKTDVAGLKSGLDRVEVKVDDLSRLEPRVAALERANR
jgi:ABC-type transporter Mla subunit MlaD